MVDRIAGSLRDNFLNAFRQQQIKKKQLLENITKESEISDANIEQDNMFNTQANQGSGLQTMDDINNKYILTETNFSSEAARGFDPNVLSNLLASYMSAAEMDVLFSYVEDEVSLDDVNKLLDEVDGAEDGEVSGLINGFFEGPELEPGAIFAVLTYLYEEVKKKQRKREKTLSLLKNLLEKFAQQNSAYLAEFFQAVNNPTIKKSPKLAAGLANLAAGNISVESLKGAIDFVDKFLEGDYDDIVSKCIRLRIQVLARMTKPKLSFEEKTELSSFVQCEKNLITINSVNNDYKKFKYLVESEVLEGAEVKSETSTVVKNIVDFANNSIIGGFALKMLLTNLGIDKDHQNDIHVKTKLVDMFVHLPMALFGDDVKKRLKFIESMRTFKISNEGNESQGKSAFSFIKPRKAPIKLI